MTQRIACALSLALTLTLALALPRAAAAEEMDIPLAVTTLAHPSLRATPTAAELAMSDRYLRSGLVFLKKNAPDRAVQDLLDSVRVAPTGSNYKALGTAYYQAGNVPKAVWAYQESLKLEPDAKVRALVDQLQGFGSDSQVMDYKAQLDHAKAEMDAGKRDSALAAYVAAWQLKRSPESASPALKLAAGLAEADLHARAVARAIEVLAQVQDLKSTPDLSEADRDSLARLDAVETETVRLSGAKLRENQAAMLSDKEAWERKLQEKLAGKAGKVELHVHQNGAGE